ncbi:hypothetical protein C8A05DRAFT_46789 [Staphylotrichum tortipilum]|uniref:Wilms tumor protein homolog n=1 Tax=Staphylotrichum tortipilum TaxID=2831512 RepID=A0AAN6MEI7_9PEZI|nr:hypothetical protein C8A05DRAFT_46789 [Staphylotrichum longicolle]
MASDRGPTATEAPRAPATSTVPQPAPSAFAPVPDLNRQKSLKRERETTPTSHDALASGGDISPSKIARLVGFARQSHAPQAGEVADGDAGRQEEDGQHHQLAQLEHSGGHGHGHEHEHAHAPQAPAADTLMSGVPAEMHRPQDAPPDAANAEMEAAAAAAARALSSVNIPTTHAAGDGLHDVSPQSGTSGASVEDGGRHVVESPSAMDVDSRDDEGMYEAQPEAQMEDRSGLPYGGAMPGLSHSQRGMSMPIGTPQTPTLDLGPRSPNSNKKHKCPYCDTEFTRHHNLKSHLLTHSQEKPYLCQACQMRFRRLHDLKRHSKLHTGEKPHVCPSCNRKFARGDALARHSKGAGGCAGRRQTMGSFGVKDGYDGGADSSAMSGDLYEGEGEGDDMSDDERQRLSMPSIKAPHVVGQVGAEGYGGGGGGHSSTYPPAGQRPGAAGGLYPPPNVDRGTSSSNTSPSMPNSHTPQTSISSIPLSAGSSSMYSQSGMTESPKPLSPGVQQAAVAGQQHRATAAATAANEQQQQQQQQQQHHGGAAGLPLSTTHGNAGQQQQPHPSSGRRGRAASGAAHTAPPAPVAHAGEPAPDAALWPYFQHLEGAVKRLTGQVEAEARGRAQLAEKLAGHEGHIAALSAEVAALRGQLAAAAAVGAAGQQQEQQQQGELEGEHEGGQQGGPQQQQQQQQQGEAVGAGVQ